MNRSYSPPASGPLSDEELAEIVADHSNRHRDNLDGTK